MQGCKLTARIIPLSGRLANKKKIYRGFEEGSDKIEINTDTRSNKIEEIKHFSFSEGTDGGISYSKYCYISGFDATSTETLSMMAAPSLPPHIWSACRHEDAPHVGSLVYFFPEEGFLEQCASVPSGIDPDLPLFLCSVESACLLADPHSDEVYSVISLNPTASPPCPFKGYHSSMSPSQTQTALVSLKVLSYSDTTSTSLSVPIACAKDIFPQLDLETDKPTQDLTIHDVHGNVHRFTHIYRGSPKRNWLTTGWSNSFKIVRRESRYVRSQVTAKEVLDAVMAAAEGRKFQVRSRDAPRLSVVAKEIIEWHVLTGSGSANVRIKMIDKVRTLVLQNATPGSLIKILGECIEEEKAEIPEVRE
ncbi:auxin response factor 18-like protein [Carex littledalei]|uniref:Auxin response factor 18-like protein n=1 Tax=Carex littledalei TaxID=544730 RepID=A0A833QTK1_9POAL|nr:auxin response factor 18-like protein [Carex littledalei]